MLKAARLLLPQREASISPLHGERDYGNIHHMAEARLIYHDKARLENGSIVEMKIWKLPGATPERPHGLKYSLYFGRGGRRIVGYDNERGKGDHRHIGDREEPYRFVDVPTLIADFLADVRERIAA